MRESVFSFFASSILYNIAHFGLAGAREASFFGVGLYFSIPHVSKTSLGTATGASPSPGSAAGTRTGHAVLSLACRKNANAGPASQSALSHSVPMNILFACLNRPTLAVSFWSACWVALKVGVKAPTQFGSSTRRKASASAAAAAWASVSSDATSAAVCVLSLHVLDVVSCVP